MKMVLTVLGIVFVVVGLLGFFNDPVLGIFEVDGLHNLIHLAAGVLALVAVGMGESAMRLYARVFGAVYLLVGVIGFVMPGDMILGLFEANMADDVLHLALGALLLYVGFMMKSERTVAPGVADPMM